MTYQGEIIEYGLLKYTTQTVKEHRGFLKAEYYINFSNPYNIEYKVNDTAIVKWRIDEYVLFTNKGNFDLFFDHAL